LGSRGSRPAHSSAIRFFASLGFRPSSRPGGALFGSLCPVVAPQTRFIHRPGNVGAFDFEKRTRLALPEEARAEGFLKTDVRIVHFYGRLAPVQSFTTSRPNKRNVTTSKPTVSQTKFLVTCSSLSDRASASRLRFAKKYPKGDSASPGLAPLERRSISVRSFSVELPA
jgi:hypothetical protein